MPPAYLDPNEIRAVCRVESTRGNRDNHDRYAALSEPARKRECGQLVAANAVELGRNKTDPPQRVLQSE